MKRVKIIASVFALLLCAALGFSWYIQGGFAPWSSEDYQYNSASDAEMDLEWTGFTNIEIIYTDVESLEEGPWSTPVTKITIDGDTDFREKQRYSANAPVKIYCNRERRIGAPFDSAELQNYAPEVLAQMFLDAGFTNVNVTVDQELTIQFMRESENRDLEDYYRTHKATLPPYFNEISIGKLSHFELGDPLPISAPIQIVGHYQPNIRIVRVKISYQDPSKAVTEPVRVYRNGELTPYWILEYGEDTALFMGLEEADGDTLTLAFQREDTAWKSEDLTYTVTEDMELSITLGSDMRILQKETSPMDPKDSRMYRDVLIENR